MLNELTDNTVQDEPTWSIPTTRRFPTSEEQNYTEKTQPNTNIQFSCHLHLNYKIPPRVQIWPESEWFTDGFSCVATSMWQPAIG